MARLMTVAMASVSAGVAMEMSIGGVMVRGVNGGAGSVNEGSDWASTESYGALPAWAGLVQLKVLRDS